MFTIFKHTCILSHEVYLQIMWYEMTLSSCKRSRKSKSHPSMKLVLVWVFSCKHPLRMNDVSKRVWRGWEGKKEGSACMQTPWFWKLSTWRFMPVCMGRHSMLSSAVLNWPIKMFDLLYSGSELVRTSVEPKQSFFGSNTWMAEMGKSQWIRTNC